ncbi:MAG: tRNA (guanine-N(1)-)-methyltransferase [Candidatus Roizmanbacteria bacterium GW2011_GWC2_37_13]|uniref:tRNA (guanine-N(1)-)-methyltransferase n=1 Tax=Candidatus Roizmanbacteria bacterium GW2011_GWC2_37_13 TaxID=1618486 RepID=A0A0G0IMU6_9BACT|nr:MAG: tRNA (guanine-N(1)-)-methyltransferase [Candidatus Roizmanbacteria bacterium GW2011_GWC1_37_12]KKQ25529.1 MAG: tRNA (guanine-N(1)-)-methyltransferase [Candidatus Roizmanbacteria bacterium GW2011_GWC2_37_13]
MKISIITLFPKMISGFFEESIIKRAVEKKLVEIKVVNLRDFAIDDYGTVDDRPYGGGVGMVIRVDVVYKAIQNLKSKISNPKVKTKILLTSPRGRLFNQRKAEEYSKIDQLIIIAGHYEGVDERVNEFIDEEVSIGDYVLTGGEIPAAAIVDSVVRLLPGVLKKDEAIKQESFNIKGKKLLEYPQYTRPEEFKGIKVPKVLMGGNHKEIEKWRLDKSLQETKKRRPDLIQK